MKEETPLTDALYHEHFDEAFAADNRSRAKRQGANMKRKKRTKVKPIDLRGEWHEEVITLAFDAFRICIGMEPKKYSAEHIIEWIRGMPSSKRKRKHQ